MFLNLYQVFGMIFIIIVNSEHLLLLSFFPRNSNSHEIKKCILDFNIFLIGICTCFNTCTDRRTLRNQINTSSVSIIQNEWSLCTTIFPWHVWVLDALVIPSRLRMRSCSIIAPIACDR